MGGRGAKSGSSRATSVAKTINKDFADLVTGKTPEQIMQDKDAMRRVTQEFGYKNINEFREDVFRVNFERSKSGLGEMDEYDTADAMRESIPDNVWTGWVVNADSSYKPKIESAIVTNPEARNAAMNVAWHNYNDYLATNGESPIGFNEFLNKPITVYRGDRGQRTTNEDVFSAFSFSRSVAESFGSNVTTRTIRPIDTLGGIQLNAEFEIMVSNRN